MIKMEKNVLQQQFCSFYSSLEFSLMFTNTAFLAKAISFICLADKRCFSEQSWAHLDFGSCQPG